LQDRYAHRILAVGCEGLPVLLLESVEGTAEDNWPSSPAFQALNLEELQGDTETKDAPLAAMLVGMSGSTHWSMTVNGLAQSALDDQISTEPGFHFDVAGRLKAPPKVLSTRYSVGKRLRALQTGERMLLHFGSGQCVVDSRSPDGIAGPLSCWQFDKRAHELKHAFVPQVAQTELPVTLRWGYSVRLTSD
jgi:hypothetical protein